MSGVGDDSLGVLVAVGEEPLGAAVTEALAVDPAVTTEQVSSRTDDPISVADDIDGAVVGSRRDDLISEIRQLSRDHDVPVVLLADADDGDRIAAAVDAGAVDVFPRTGVRGQCDLIVDSIATERSRGAAVPAGDEPEGPVGDRAYREVFENVTDGLVVHDVETGEIIDVNGRFCEMNGYAREELLGESIDLVTPPDDEYSFEAASEMFERARAEGPQLFEWRNQHRNGETFPVEVHLSVVRLHGTERVLASVRDITERKRRKREYEQIFNSVHDSIVVHDPETAEMVDVNEAFCELMGYDRETILELGTAGVSVQEEGYTEARAEEVIAEVMEQGGVEPFEWKVETADGEQRILEVRATTAEIGGERRHISINRDITERKRREREFEQIFNGVHGGITINDPETGEFIEVNDSFCELLGYDHDTVLELGIEGVSAPDERFSLERARDIIQEVMETGEPKQFEWTVETADGERRHLEVRGTTAEIGGERRYVSLTRDVTERRRREREYEQIFNGVNDGIAIQDPETADVLDVNQTFVDRLGYEDVDAVLEQGYEGLTVTEAGYTRVRAQELCQRVMETGEPETVEWQIERKDGTPVLVEVTVSPAVIGGEDRIISIQRDITEQRQLERRLGTIAERIEEMIHFVDVDTREVLFVNEAFSEIFGRPTETLYEDPEVLFEAIHPDDRSAHEADIKAMFADMQEGTPDDSYEFDFRIERPDGETRWLESTVYPILEDATESGRYVGVTKDVTEQHHRQQTLETFHEVTRELTAADSREAACRQAVRAAEGVLGFPLVSAYLYDDETGELEPTAITNRLTDLGVDPPSFGPGDALPWQVFVEGEAVTSTDAMPDVYGPGVSSPDVVLPLGTHGVMLVGAPAETFDTEDIELAQILAATLEASLNHVAGERELAEREAELRRQQERADQLKQLNDIIRDIEQATVDESSRTGIEEAVCERLVDVDMADLVWVGESATGSDELVPNTSAGGDGGYLDALSVGGPGDTDSHPAVEAYQNEEARVVENVATDVSPGDWRTRALRYGVQSVIAVPIRYETTVHGVLAIEADTPDAFDEATRDVLAELGRSIGYAITVTERERALESEGTTELEFAVADDGLFMTRAASIMNCRVDLERTIRRAGGAFSTYYTVEHVDPDELVEMANTTPSVESAQVVSAAEDGSGGLIEVTSPSWFGSVFTEHGAVVREATVSDGEGTLVVEAPRGSDVRALVEGFQERYPETDLVAQRQRERTIRSLFELQDALRDELTARQWEALETAYSAGYFEWPREVSGEEVAELLGVSQPTLNKHLRIGERTAFEMLLDRGYPDEDDR